VYIKVGTSQSYQTFYVWGPDSDQVAWNHQDTSQPYINFKKYGHGVVKVLIETISDFTYWDEEWRFGSTIASSGWITVGYIGVYK
jgi:hypothetical protein